MQIMTTSNLFLYYKNTERIAFWSSIKNGLDIYMQETQLLLGYDGIIYRPQVFNLDQDNALDNSTGSVVTLFNTDLDGSLMLYYVQVEVQFQGNFTIETKLIQELNVTISDDMRSLIADCENDKSQVVISQLDQDHYIGTCKEGTSVFLWSLNESYIDTVIDL